MKKDSLAKDILRQIIITVIAVLINCGGGVLATRFSFPFWCDSLGTVFAAYLLGPVSGAIIGAGSNIISSFISGSFGFYFITSIAIGLIVGFAARKKMFETFFGSMSIATILTFVSMGVSLPLNFITTKGMTTNVWGDAVINYLDEQGLGVTRFIIGQYYLDFVDKTLAVLILFAAIHGYRYIKEKLKNNKLFNRRISKKTVAAALLILFSFSSFITLSGTVYASGVTDSSAEENTSDANASEETESTAAETSFSTDYSSYVQTIYDNTNGLPCGEANDIATTNDGILWVGTYAGLYRYNGRAFTHMDYDSVKNVNCLYTDLEGRLWIGTNDNGLSIAINEKISNVITSDNGLPSDSVRSIGGGQNGIYYVGTSQGLALVSLAGGLHIIKTFDTIADVISIDTDNSGRVACVTSSGKLYYITDGSNIRNVLENPDSQFTSVKFTDDGRLLAGTAGNTLFTYSISDNNVLSQGSVMTLSGIKQINAIYPIENEDDIFVVSDEGIGYLDGENGFVLLKTGAFTNSIEAMTMDYQGDLWFASSRMGLMKMAYSGVTDLFQTAGLPENVVNTVYKWSGYLYIGTDTGLYIMDSNTYSIVQNEITAALDGVRIRCIFASSVNALWICTDGRGVIRLNNAGEITTIDSTSGLFGDKARVAIKYGDGIAVAGNGGISLINEDGSIENTIVTSQGAAKILCLTALSDGTLLAGTDGDGIAVVRDGKISKYITKKDGISSNVILKLPKYEKNVFAVTSNGICYSNDGINYDEVTNFPYSNNYDICFDKNGSAFIIGSSGIYVTAVENLINNTKDMITELWNANQGFTYALTANAYNFLDADENYYVSSNHGIYEFNLSTFSGDYHTYRISVPKVNVDGRSYDLENGMPFTISRDAGRVTLSPEIINYSTENPYITYTLKGFDKKTYEMPLSELSEISYNNLPAGRYTFTISVLGRDRETEIEQEKMVFIKEKSLYDENYFNFYFFGIAGASIAWFTWLIFRTQVGRTLKMQMKEVEIAKKQVQMSNDAILTIAKTLDARDERTSKHSERVSEYSVMIARKMGFSEAECENLRKAALLHDIGKIGVPDAILNKPARLTDEEYDIMKTHVTKGAEILKNFTGIDHVVEGALYHHERYDGHGYVTGLKGKDIPLYGRIIGVADAFDAMTANRVYRKQLDIDFVLEELVRCSGTQFDPEIADIMIALVVSGELNIEEIYHSKEKKEGDES